jgi:hypothetical protein
MLAPSASAVGCVISRRQVPRVYGNIRGDEVRLQNGRVSRSRVAMAQRDEKQQERTDVKSHRQRLRPPENARRCMPSYLQGRRVRARNAAGRWLKAFQ